MNIPDLVFEIAKHCDPKTFGQVLRCSRQYHQIGNTDPMIQLKGAEIYSKWKGDRKIEKDRRDGFDQIVRDANLFIIKYLYIINKHKFGLSMIFNCAVKWGNLPVVEYLSRNPKLTPLFSNPKFIHKQCIKNRPKIVEILIENPVIKPKSQTFIVVCQLGQSEIVQVLLGAKFDLQVLNEAYIQALYHRQWRIVQILLGTEEIDITGGNFLALKQACLYPEAAEQILDIVLDDPQVTEEILRKYIYDANLPCCEALFIMLKRTALDISDILHSVLAQALTFRHYRLIKYLNDNYHVGKYKNIINNYSGTDANIVELILPYLKVENKARILKETIMSSNLITVKLLMVDPEIDYSGLKYDLLHLGIISNDVDFTSSILKEIDTFDEQLNLKYFKLAVARGSVKIVELLLSQNRIKSSQSVQQLLMHACECNQIEIFTLFQKELDTTNINYTDIINYVIQHSRPKFIEILLTNSKCRLDNSSREKLLFYACKGHCSLLQLLLHEFHYHQTVIERCIMDAYNSIRFDVFKTLATHVHISDELRQRLLSSYTRRSIWHQDFYRLLIAP